MGSLRGGKRAQQPTEGVDEGAASLVGDDGDELAMGAEFLPVVAHGADALLQHGKVVCVASHAGSDL